MTDQSKQTMTYSGIGVDDDISNLKNKSLPSRQHKMNRNYNKTVKAYFSYLRSPSALTRSVSTSGPFRKSIFPWFPEKNFTHAIFLFAFVCSCIPLNAVSGEHFSDLSDSSTNYKIDGGNDSEPAITKPCSNCKKIDLERLANLTLLEIKSQILHRLGFTNGTPNSPPSKMPPVDMLSKIPSVDMLGFHHRSSHIRHEASQKFGPSFMQNDEAKFLDDGDDRLKTHMVFAKAKEVNVGSGLPRRPLLFTFESLSKGRVTNARLLLYQRALPKDHLYSNAFKLSVVKIHSKGTQAALKQFDHNLNDSGGWIDFDFGSDIATKHFATENGDSLHVNLMLYARFMQQNTTSDVPLIIDLKKCDSLRSNDPDCINVPYLQLEIEEPKSRRNKRSAYPDCRPDLDNFNQCCRYPLIVDFEAFKWDFIIAPKRYNAHYCAGECTYLSQQKYVHTHLLTLSQNGDNKITPCCGPRSMASITMLYFNSNNNIVYGVLPGMVVERCGCQ